MLLLACILGLQAGRHRALAETPTPHAAASSEAAPATSEVPADQTPSSVSQVSFLNRLPPVSEGSVAPFAALQTSAPVVAAPAKQPVNPDYAPPDLQPREYQSAPGAPEFESNYDRASDRVPNYVYTPRYYDSFVQEIQQLADYAPPGYEVRDYQSAPGVPEYSPVTPPVRVSQADRERFLVGGIAPGSFLAPGTNTSVRMRGFVRLAALYDFNPMGVPDAFVPNSIPVPQTYGRNFNMSARMSRFNLETWTPTTWADRTVHTMIEGDFFNGAGQAAGGGGNPFRLRHAFFDFGWFRFGQQNSVYMDGTNWPSLVDFQGPNGWINQRQPSLRMTVPVVNRIYWATSVERPFSDISTNGLGTNVQDVPDFATHLRWEGDVGHLQIGGLFRSIGFRSNAGDVSHVTGTGVSGSAVYHPWAILLGTNPVTDPCPSGLTRSRILLQCTYGPGTSRYVNDTVGLGLDAQVDPLSGELKSVRTTAWNTSYEHWFNEHWLTNLTYSQACAKGDANQPIATYLRGQYLAWSFWWIPITRMSFGVEYNWGSRENIDGQAATANRFQSMFQYNF